MTDDRDLLDAVKAWALARGWNTITRDSGTVAISDGNGVRSDAYRTGILDVWTAALWVLLVDSGLRADVGECPACDGRRHQFYTRLTPDAPWPEYKREGWVPGAGADYHRSRPCPACEVDGKPTGRDMRDAAQLLLDATPLPWHARGADHAQRISNAVTVLVARAQLAVLAEGLLKRGSDLGELLAAWLAPVESDARAQYRALLLWCVTFAAVQVAQGEQLAALGEPLAIWRWRPGIRSITGVGGVEFRIPGLIPEADAALRARVLDALRESRPKRITHARTPQNKSA